jgi:hypothetical protein
MEHVIEIASLKLHHDLANLQGIFIKGKSRFDALVKVVRDEITLS